MGVSGNRKPLILKCENLGRLVCDLNLRPLGYERAGHWLSIAAKINTTPQSFLCHNQRSLFRPV
jgi:hypothetical protein